ncbi:protein phosphatase 4 core regulatory subunit R2 [Endogone sp. FLAS-F59071]|nr:protein phosphatase 4 core regulatory subunit R2 [Endogone sp. FLAS-F59071]|eukprot:RUS19407.1 protein phosphatase 4 core regulatory subunit R2 [Endogone sp. FLAS-F59071]
MTDPDTITQETWSAEYEDILANIAQSNQVQTPWHLLRNILKTKLRQNVSSSSMPNVSTPSERPEDYQDRILSILDAFQGPPFTIQRLCELLTKPTEHHKTMIKYLRAMEKVVMVTSSFDEFPEPTLISSITVNGTASGVVAASESSLVSSSINITTEPTLEQIVFHHQLQPSMVQDGSKGESEGGDEDVVVTDATDNAGIERAVALETREAPSAGVDELSSTAIVTDGNAAVVVSDEAAVVTEDERVDDEGVEEKPAAQPQQSETENKAVEQEKEDPMDMDG